MLITEKSKSIARHYLTSSVFSSKVLIKWLAIASMVGIIVGVIASAFGHTLIAVNNFRAAHPMIILGLPFAGLLIVFLYRYFKDQDDGGTNMVIASIHSSVSGMDSCLSRSKVTITDLQIHFTSFVSVSITRWIR